MKYIFFLLTLFILNGCSQKNAFSNFDMDKSQQLSMQYYKKIKLTKNNKTIGIFSSIYLNKVYPEIYKDNEYFYISSYIKDTYNSKEYTIKLNGKSPIEIKKLNFENKFSKLTKEKNKWSKYYLISFEKTDKNIKLTINDHASILGTILYTKE